MLDSLQYTPGMRTLGEIDVFGIAQNRQFLAMAIGDHDAEGVTAQHIFVRPGTARSQYTLQRDMPLLGDIA